MLLNNGGNSKVSQTIKILYTQLNNYKLFGAPKIPHIPLTKSEINHVRSELFDELNFCEQSFPVFDEHDDVFDDDLEEIDLFSDLQCVSCQSVLGD